MRECAITCAICGHTRIVTIFPKSAMGVEFSLCDDGCPQPDEYSQKWHKLRGKKAAQ